ncbi:endoglucanase [Anaeromyces robustus]|uniref:Endoglucanase n=1 Tax=Anaeromyces robustus TaxID=1754192 RepID=A0A1Y1XCR1_9FUNG|nr:endoglucanase [Anaeromyces robustus]|eukprot:ORX83528.1 endoglucanase [Anaeromyces robustus]
MKLLNVLLTLGCAGSTFALTSIEFAKQLGFGWNLGNTLEACGDWINGKTTQQYETAWGNPVTSEKLIKAVKSYGFNTIRIPVAWSNLMLADYTINPLLLNRVAEVVGYVVNNDMYAIMNIHWDMGWFSWFSEPEKEEEAFKKYTKVWTQISEHFKDFSDHLIFESLNEQGCWDNVWNTYNNNGSKSKAYDLLNNINQRFVDIVRASSGNNPNRYLLLAGYCTGLDLTMDEAYVFPKDDKLMVSVHYYSPSTFAILEEDADWGKCARTWGTEAEVNNVIYDFSRLKNYFVTERGIPVIIGEYGTPTTNKEPESIHKYLKTVASTALEYDLCPVVWDAGQYFDRRNLKFKDPEVGMIYKELAATYNNNNDNGK